MLLSVAGAPPRVCIRAVLCLIVMPRWRPARAAMPPGAPVGDDDDDVDTDDDDAECAPPGTVGGGSRRRAKVCRFYE